MNIERFKSYTVEAYLEDPEFRDWVENPTPRAQELCQRIVEAYPDQAVILSLALTQLTTLRSYFDSTDQHMEQDELIFGEKLERIMRRAKSRKRREREVRRRRHGLVAASLLLLIMSGIWWWTSTPSQMQIYATGYEEWKTVDLPDGSVVKLNANSELRIPKQWEEGTLRKVWLKGEGFFEIVGKPQAGAKFQVVTGELTIEVLGTSFNVHSRGDRTNVFLEEGKIRLDLGQEEKYLDPGELIEYSGQKKAITKQYKASAERHISWKDGTLFLKDATTSEILKKLEEIYGVSITVRDEDIFSELKTVAVPMDKLSIAIPILERTLGVRIERNDKQLILN